jgi:proteasome lid subunit RPN8/RPN11
MLGWLTSLLSFWRRRARAPASTRIERIVLTEGVARTLFDDYTEHRRSIRGDEEFGWILLGHREGEDAIARAALPAGANRDAGAVHVQFDAQAQALASRIVRQKDKRLHLIGVVHTHPGSLRVPSEGDLQGDRRWVAHLRSCEAVFAIGTADVLGQSTNATNVQVEGELCFSWYALAVGDAGYRPLPITAAPGPDLAESARAIWETIETFADSVEHLCRQFANVQLDLQRTDAENALAVKITLPSPGEELRLLLYAGEARYYWQRGDEVIAIDPHDPNLVRAVHLILAELAKEAEPREVESLIEN